MSHNTAPSKWPKGGLQTPAETFSALRRTKSLINLVRGDLDELTVAESDRAADAGILDSEASELLNEYTEALEAYNAGMVKAKELDDRMRDQVSALRVVIEEVGGMGQLCTLTPQDFPEDFVVALYMLVVNVSGNLDVVRNIGAGHKALLWNAELASHRRTTGPALAQHNLHRILDRSDAEFSQRLSSVALEGSVSLTDKAELQKKLQITVKHYDDATKKLEKSKNLVRDLNTRIEALTKANEKLEAHNAELFEKAQTGSRVAELTAELVQLRSDLEGKEEVFQARLFDRDRKEYTAMLQSKEDITELESQIRRKDISIRNLERAMDSLEVEKSTHAKEFVQMDKTIRDLRGDCSAAERELSAARARIKNLVNENGALVSCNEACTQRNEELLQEAREMQQRLDNSTRACNKSAKREDQLMMSSLALEKRIDTINQDARKVLSERNGLFEERIGLRGSADELTRKVRAHEQVIEEFEMQVSSLKKEIETMRAMRQRISELEDCVKMHESAAQGQSDAMGILEERYENLRAEAATNNSKCKTLEQANEGLRTEAVTRNTGIAALQSKNEGLRVESAARMAKIDTLEAVNGRLRIEGEDRDLEMKSLEETNDRLRAEGASREKEIATLKRSNDELRAHAITQDNEVFSAKAACSKLTQKKEEWAQAASEATDRAKTLQDQLAVADTELREAAERAKFLVQDKEGLSGQITRATLQLKGFEEKQKLADIALSEALVDLDALRNERAAWQEEHRLLKDLQGSSSQRLSHQEAELREMKSRLEKTLNDARAQKEKLKTDLKQADERIRAVETEEAKYLSILRRKIEAVGQTMSDVLLNERERASRVESSVLKTNEARQALQEELDQLTRAVTQKDETLLAMRKWAAVIMSINGIGRPSPDLSQWNDLAKSVEDGMVALSLRDEAELVPPMPKACWSMLRPWCTSDKETSAPQQSDIAIWRLYSLFLDKKPFTQEGFACLAQTCGQRTWALPEVDTEFLLRYEAVLTDPNRSPSLGVVVFTIAMWQYLVNVLHPSMSGRPELYNERQIALETYIVTKAPSLMRNWFEAMKTYETDSIRDFCNSNGLFFDSEDLLYLVSDPEISWALIVNFKTMTWRVVQCSRGSFSDGVRKFKIEAPRGNTEDDISLSVPIKTHLGWLLDVFITGPEPTELIEVD
ncbi:hypothetical protein F4803DRAFT_557862 [Xylaria telfairii]|nr:hypothetical protein F4803DRAFT_557862 [Xylaria telfairii]